MKAIDKECVSAVPDVDLLFWRGCKTPPHRVLGRRAGIHELQEIGGPAGLKNGVTH
jgi:hypothetical protein